MSTSCSPPRWRSAPRCSRPAFRAPFSMSIASPGSSIPPCSTASCPAYVNTTSARVAGGLGTIPRIVCEHEEIYAGRLSFREAERRIRSYYLPYHAMLQRLMSDTVAQFGLAVLVDCHSMPSSAASGTPARSRRPDVVLGDRYGSSCEAEIAALPRGGADRPGAHRHSQQALCRRPYHCRLGTAGKRHPCAPGRRSTAAFI